MKPSVNTTYESVLLAVHYADIFDQALAVEEIHRRMVARATSRSTAADALQTLVRSGSLAETQGYFHLPERERLVGIRQRRRVDSDRLRRRAAIFIRAIGALPFVRMVSVTGALAVDNATAGDDVDLFVVTAPRRLWMCRATVIAIVRLAAIRGLEVCPNYFLTIRQLSLDERTLYSAHEMAQMVPVFGVETFGRMMNANEWWRKFLPNWPESDVRSAQFEATRLKWLKRAAEVVLGLPMLDIVERWESRRKIRRLAAIARVRAASGASFTQHECKGHFEAHDQRILKEFDRRRAVVQSTLADIATSLPPTWE